MSPFATAPHQEVSERSQGVVITILLTSLMGFLLYFLHALDPSHLLSIMIILSPVFFLISFFSIKSGLIFVVLSMLLSPEIPLGSISSIGGGMQSINIRMEDLIIPILVLAWVARLAIRKEFRLLASSPINKPIFSLLAVRL